jgi:hypothetical protein
MLRPLVAVSLVAAAIVAIATVQPVSAGSGVPQTKYFDHCGTASWTVPSDVGAVTVTVSGAAGGAGNGDGPGHAPGGLGGQSIGRLATTPGEDLTVVVGCRGAEGGGQVGPSLGGSGYGTGGDGGQHPDGFANAGGGGGGGSAVLRGGTALVVAGGGGGGGADGAFDGQPETAFGGAGGGPNSAGGDAGEDMVGCGGGGATTSAPGTAGDSNTDGNAGVGTDGGDGVVDLTQGNIGGFTTSGGGGGGFFGGGSGGAHTNFPCGGGGGGSGHVDAGASSVSGQDGVRAGDGRVVIDFDSDVVAIPGTDDDERATLLTGTSGSAALVDTTDASAQVGEPAHAGEIASHSVWYRLLSPFNGRARIDTLTSDFDTVLAVYTVDAGSHSFTEVASNNDEPGGAGSGSPSLVTFPIAQAQTYLIAVDGFGGDSGTVALGYQLAQPRPDGRVRVGAAGPLRGNDVYGTLIGQSVSSGAPRGGTAAYRVSVQNDSGLSERLALRGQPSARGFVVRYRTPSGANITTNVVAGTFRTPPLRPGGTYVVRVEVTVTRRAAASQARTVRATSAVDGRFDTVLFTTRRR